MNKRRDLMLSGASALTGRALAAFGGVLLPLVIARATGVETFGLFSIAHTLLLILAIPAAAGTPITMMRYVGPRWHDQQYDALAGIYHAGSRLVLLVAVPIALALALLAPTLAVHVFAKPELGTALLAIALALPAAAICSLHAGFLKGMQRAATGSLLEWGGLALLTLVLWSVIPLWTTPTLTNVMGTLVAAHVLAACGSYWLLRSRIGNSRTGAPMPLRTLASSGKDAALTQLGAFLNASSAIVILGILSTERETGLFSAASRLAFLISFLLIVVNAVVPPRMASLYERDNRAGLETLAVQTALLVAAIALPVACAFLVLPGFWLGFFGASFAEAAPLLQILTIGQFINAITGSVGYLLMMADQGHIMRRISVCSAIITVLMLAAVVPVYGSIGAAWVSTASMAAQNLLAAWFVWKKLGIRTIPGWNWLSRLKSRPQE